MDEPHPGEQPEVFMCRGTVYRGYKSDCPDYKLLTIARWKQAWDEFWDVSELRKHPDCLKVCGDLAWAPTAVGLVCTVVITTPVVTPYVAAGKTACSAMGLSTSYQLAGAGLAAFIAGRVGESRFCPEFCARGP